MTSPAPTLYCNLPERFEPTFPRMAGVMRAPLLVLLFAFLSSAICAQTTWVVDLFNRPGAHFTDLPAAVTAASSGDVILLRATTASLADSYLAPTIQGKGVTILGEVGVGLPRVQVTGAWNISGIPLGEVVILSNLSMTGAYFGDGPGGVTRIFFWSVTDCVGSVICNRVSPIVFGVANQPTFRDNALMVFSDCVFDTLSGSLPFVRCKVMMNNTQVIRTNPGAGSGNSSVTLLDSEMHLAGSSIRGADGNALNSASSSAVRFTSGSTRGKLLINRSSRLEAGVNTFGSRATAVTMIGTASACMAHLVERDPLATIIEGVPGGCMPITVTPVSGLRTSQVQNVLQIDHDTTPNAPAILLMAPLQTTPWDNIIGPCFLDQNFVWSSFAVAPVAGALRHTFTIPPTIPLGQWVGVQAFEFDAPRNRVIGTNVTVVGVL